MVQGRLLQTAFYLLVFAISGNLIALALNWRNDYWMNGILIAFANPGHQGAVQFFPFGWDRPKRSIRCPRLTDIYIESASRDFDVAQAPLR
jgi:hypothetical protein